MKKYRFITKVLMALLGLIIVNSCDKADNDKKGIVPFDFNKDVIISEIEYKNAPDDPFAIIEMNIEGDSLKVKFSANGCDGNTWAIKLIDSGLIAESSPCQRTLRLSLENKEACTAVITKEVFFNIQDLQILGDDKVILHVSGEGILYEY